MLNALGFSISVFMLAVHVVRLVLVSCGGYCCNMSTKLVCCCVRCSFVLATTAAAERPLHVPAVAVACLLLGTQHSCHLGAPARPLWVLAPLPVCTNTYQQHA
jgi:hypothetical protein